MKEANNLYNYLKEIGDRQVTYDMVWYDIYSKCFTPPFWILTPTTTIIIISLQRPAAIAAASKQKSKYPLWTTYYGAAR